MVTGGRHQFTDAPVVLSRLSSHDISLDAVDLFFAPRIFGKEGGRKIRGIYGFLYGPPISCGRSERHVGREAERDSKHRI